MATTIQISNELKKVLDRCKISDKDSYNDILFNILEDAGLLEFSEDFKEGLKEAEKDIKEGRTLSFKDFKKKFYNGSNSD